MPRLRPSYLVLALTLFAALAVGVTGSILLSRYREAALAAIADRQGLLVSLQARHIEGEIGHLVAEMTRLSQLAEVDLADHNLEPEKRVLKVARRDTALFSVAIMLLDADGAVVWSEPQGAAPPGDPKDLVADAHAVGGDVTVFDEGELDIAAPIKGGGAIVAQVSARTHDLFGEALLGALRGGSAELLAETDDGDVLVASAGTLFPLSGDADGQSWRTDARGRRWLHTEIHLGGGPIAFRVAQPAAALEGEVAAPLRNLVGIVAVAVLIAITGGGFLAIAIGRLERAEIELGRSRELAAMGKTAAAIAHEVKNSLNGLSIALDLLASGRAPAAAAAEVHGRARTEIARLRGVADDLTLFAAPPRLALADTDVVELCRHAAAACADLAQDCGAEIALEAPAEPVVMWGDEHKLLGALENVVRNGVEAMGPGAFGEALGAPPTARVRRLDVSLRSEGREAVIEVADRGPGIAAEVRGRLFEPFVSAKRTGTGLGLAIAKRVVEAHGGRISVHEREGGGTVFRVVLPKGEEPQRALASAAG